MAIFDEKAYLDFPGLEAYDALIKEYVKKLNNSSSENIDAEIERAEAAEQAIIDSLTELANGAVKSNTDAIAVLNGDSDTEGSVAKQVQDAVAGVVDGAPEAFDTLKEIAQWIADDPAGSVSLVNRIAELEQENVELKEYVDEKDIEVYNSIKSIADLKIIALFPEKQEGTVLESIASMDEGTALQLDENQIVEEELEIPSNVYIDANGAEFNNTVTIGEGSIVENAIFNGPVIA